jgi:hypothetical protein
VAPLMRSAVAGVDSQQPVGQIRTMDDLIAQSVAPRRLNLSAAGGLLRSSP